MIASLPDLILVIIGYLAVLAAVATFYVRYSYGYWKRRNTPYLEPTFPFGNGDSLIPKGFSLGVISKKFYDGLKSKGHRAGGIFIGMKPMLIVLHPDWVKDVLIRNFQYFNDRGLYTNEKDPLSVHLFTQPYEKWKLARAKFTPLFTSVRIRAMFGTMLECNVGLKDALAKLEAQKGDVDIVEVTACFATDIIGSCALGIDCNSFKNPNAEFRTIGRKFFTEFSFMDKLNTLLIVFTPNLAKKLGVRAVQKDVSRFFLRTILDTVEYREKNNVRRNDLLQLLIDMKNSEEIKLTMNELVGQVFVFFIGAFETSSTIAAMALFEISKNEEVQNRMRQEIREVLRRYDGRITYDALAEMKYLEQVADETLRLWPPVNINRMCVEDHKFPNSDFTVEKGTPILIPVLGLHRDPDYWPDPDKWDPDRFGEGNRSNIRPSTFLPFGEGPRNCIGLRFEMIQMKTTLVTILKDYRVSLSPNTVLPLELDPEYFVLHTKNKIYLRLEKIGSTKALQHSDF